MPRGASYRDYMRFTFCGVRRRSRIRTRLRSSFAYPENTTQLHSSSSIAKLAFPCCGYYTGYRCTPACYPAPSTRTTYPHSISSQQGKASFAKEFYSLVTHTAPSSSTDSSGFTRHTVTTYVARSATRSHAVHEREFEREKLHSVHLFRG